MRKLAIIGEFNPASETHAGTTRAIEHSRKLLQVPLDVDWVPTDDISENRLNRFHGFLVAPGSPYRDMMKALFAIKYARENDIPILGTCGGFQHMIIEYARNVRGHEDAHHGEYAPDASELFISPLSCSLRGREMLLKLSPGSKVASMYGRLQVKERYYCNFGVNPAYVDTLGKGPIRFVGSDSEGELRVLELPGHRFFVGTLFVPQTNSTEKNPHPLVTGLLMSINEV